MALLNVLMWSCIVAVVLAGDGDVPIGPTVPPQPPAPTTPTTTPKPTITTKSTTTITTKPTVTTTTTEKPTITTSIPTTPSTTTTPPSTTTTPPSTTTTPPSTTTTPATTPSTPATTTKAPPITTTSKPMPPTPVNPTPGIWSVNQTNSNTSCIVLQAAIQIDIIYKEANETTLYPVNVPVNASASGNCSEKQQTITLTWIPDKKNVSDEITLVFARPINETYYNLTSIVIKIAEPLPNNDSQPLILVHDDPEFSTTVDHSYRCAQDEKLNLTHIGSSNETVAYFHISHLQLQAFRNVTGKDFSSAIDCAGSGTPDVVPIAVGCALAALVIIVLVAYLYGRRRSQARGYLSM